MPTIAGRGQSRDPWSLHVAAQPQLLDRPIARGYTRHGTIMRPRTVHSAAHATAILKEGATDRRVLPRWIQRSVIGDTSQHQPLPADLAHRHRWQSREHWIKVVIPLAYYTRRDVMTKERICLDTLRRWAEAKSLYAQGGDPSRVVITPKTLAGLMQCSIATAKRYNRAARAAGLEYVVEMGRMLTEPEIRRARRCGSTQRGLATVVALCTPQEVVHRAINSVNKAVDRNPPTRGVVSYLGKSSSAAIKVADATEKTQQTERAWPRFSDPPATWVPHQTVRNPHRSDEHPPTRTQQHPDTPKPPQRRRKLRDDPGIGLATELAELVPWLRKCPRGRIAPLLNRFARASSSWTGTRLMRAMDNVNIRRNYNSPTDVPLPWAMLAWYLRQIDPIADAPDAAQLVPRD